MSPASGDPVIKQLIKAAEAKGVSIQLMSPASGDITDYKEAADIFLFPFN